MGQNFIFIFSMEDEVNHHKSEDFKISAVNYYVNNDVSIDDVCEIFGCKRSSLQRWIIRYQETGQVKRINKEPISYKITEEQVKYAIKLLKQNQQITMEALLNKVKEKYKDLDITPQWLGKVLRDNNITRKRSRHKHYPAERN